jgi:replicative DNA helicase
MKRKHNLGLIIIDYIQLMQGDTRGNREQEISGISRGLKILAKNLEVPVMALSQLSRKCEDRADKKPLLSDLRESGAIEQDADIVCFLFRPEYYGIEQITTEIGETSSKGIAEIITAKNRNGKTGSSICNFTGEFMKFTDIQGLVKLEPKFDLF